MIFSNATATTYNDKVVRQFTVMTVIWGVVGMLMGVIIAAQLTWPELNLGISWLSYGRLRPLHTNAVIFAFGGCGLFAAAYYTVQRTCHVRLFSDKLAAFTFWGWQAVIVLAAISLPLGFTQSKEYAELEWPIDLLITFVWVSFAIVFFGTIGTRKVRHIYGRYGAMVVRPQCGRILFDGRLFGHDVLLHSQASRTPCLLVSPVDRSLLGLDFHLHVGGPSPLAFHRATRLDSVGGYGVFAHFVGTELGRHDQRHHDAVRRLAQTA